VTAIIERAQLEARDKLTGESERLRALCARYCED